MCEEMASTENRRYPNTHSKSESEVKTVDKETHRNHHFFGLFFSFCAGLFYATASICGKRLKYIASPQLTTNCCIVMMLSNIPVIVYKRIPFLYSLKINIGLVVRAVFTAMAFNFTFLSIMYIPLADASVIGSCSPIFTTVFARIFLKEPCGILHSVCLILTIAGVILVSKIPLVLATRTMQFGMLYFMGVSFAVTGALSFAMANIIVRLPSLISVHYSISVFYIGAIAVVITAVVANFTFGFSLPMCGVDRFYMPLQAIMGGTMEVMVTLALQYEEASIVIMMVSTTNIVTTFLWQTLVDGISPDVYTIIGAAIVIMCILMIGLREKLLTFIKKNFGKKL